MGQFRVEIVATGGHGCQREVKDGESVQPSCGYPETCPDCRVRAFVADFRRSMSVEKAELTHWPGTPSEVRDDLLTLKRTGSFGR